MEYQLFCQRFIEAGSRARDFAQKYIVEELPSEIRFNLKLNKSHDDSCPYIVLRFPEDSALNETGELDCLTVEKVLEYLWRDGHIPQWIDLAVEGEDGKVTLVEVTCCGRFTFDDEILYHQEEGRPPFHVVGPGLPYGLKKGERFSIYNSSTCKTLKEFHRLISHAEEVRSLTLVGPDFTDDSMTADFNFPNLKNLFLTNTKVRGPGLKALASSPGITGLNLGCSGIDELDLGFLPADLSPNSLSIKEAPAHLKGMARISEILGKDAWFFIDSAHPVQADSAFILDAPRRLHLDLPAMPDWIKGTREIQDLHAEVDNASDEEIIELIEGSLDTLGMLELKGTSVTDRIFQALEGAENLKYVGLMETNVSTEALDKFAEGRPGLLYFPRKW